MYIFCYIADNKRYIFMINYLKNKIMFSLIIICIQCTYVNLDSINHKVYIFFTDLFIKYSAEYLVCEVD